MKGKNHKLDQLIKKKLAEVSIGDKEEKPVKKKQRTSFHRLNEATESNKLTFRDELSHSDDYSQCVLKFDTAHLVSNNDLLRIDNREIFKYKKSWEKRVGRLLSSDFLDCWNSGWEGMVKIEYIYSRSGNFLDLDGMSAALKAVIDGLVVGGLLSDDSQREIPIQLPYQVKGDSALTLVITKIDDPMIFFSETARSLINK